MVVLIKILQVILALSFLILIHEFGHFAFSKMFGIRVDKFFLFFDIGDVKLFSTKSKWFLKICPKAAQWETEYGIGWLPLGGYCKVCGMVDESMDLEGLKGEPQPWEFRTHSTWQRFWVMFGGVLNNFLFAILAYVFIIFIWGTSYIANEGSAIYVNDLAYEMGFRNGDHILLMDDYAPYDFGMLQADLARRNVRKVTVLRDGETLDLYVDHSMIGDVLNTPGMFDLAVPFVVDSFSETSLNRDSGLCVGDQILSVGGLATPYVQDSRDVLAQFAGQQVDAMVLRSADTLDIPLQVDSLGLVGVSIALPNVRTMEYNFWQAIPAGCKHTFSTIGGYLKDLRLVATPSTQAYKSVGSFIAIGQVFPSTWDWYQFLEIVALLSIVLAVMNLLPIPGLDGGHILFIIYEMISGRKPSEKFLIGAQMVGMLILFMLMFLAFGNDIGRLIK